MSNLIDKKLPKNWAATTVGQICYVVGGGTPSTERTDFWVSGTPWITSADLFAITDVRPRRQVTDEAIKSSATNRVPAGSVIVATRVGLGKVGLAPTDICFSQDCHGLVFDDSYISPLFLTYFLQVAVQEFKHVSRGTTIAGVTKKQLVELPVWLPPLPEQRRIVGEIEKHFTRLDAAVASLQRARANLKRYRASVLKAACEGRLVPTEAELARKEGRSYEPASVLLGRILKERRARWEAHDGRRGKYREPQPPDTSNLQPLPEGWTWATTKQISDSSLGKMLDQKRTAGERLPYLRNLNVRWNGFDLSDSLEMPFKQDELDRYSLLPGDVLVCEGGEPGRAAVWTGESREIKYQKALHRVRLYSGIEPRWLVYNLWNDANTGRLEKYFTGTTIKHFTGVSFERYLLRLPPFAEQQRIVEEVERHMSVIQAAENVVEANLKRAERLRQAILKRAFEGKLHPQDPADEPASVLLERIRKEREQTEASSIARRRKGVRRSKAQEVPA